LNLSRRLFSDDQCACSWSSPLRLAQPQSQQRTRQERRARGISQAIASAVQTPVPDPQLGLRVDVERRERVTLQLDKKRAGPRPAQANIG